MKKKYIVLTIATVLCFALIIGAVSLYREALLSPYDYICEHPDLEADMLVPYEHLGTAVKGEEVFVFYLNQNKYVSCAVLRERIPSYQLLRYSGALAMDDGLSMYSTIRECDGEDLTLPYEYHVLIWKIVADSNVSDVLIEGDSAEMLDIPAYGIRIYFVYGDYYDKIEHREPHFELIYKKVTSRISAEWR